MSSPLAPLTQLTLARWRSFVREPSVVFWSFGFPLLLSLVLGVAFRSRPPEPVPVAVETGADAPRLYAALARRADVRASVLAPAAAREALRTGRVALVVAPGTPRRYRYDPAQPESRLARLVVDDALQRADGRADPTAVTDAHVTERGSRYIDFLLPGLICLGLFSGGLWGMGFALVDMRVRKLLKRFAATPMRRSDFLLSFLVMRAVFVVLELPVLIGFGHAVFGVPVRGSLVLLFVLGLLGAFAFAALGLLVASRAQNTQTVSGLTNLVNLPMFLVSGVFFSAARFPAEVQPYLRALPLTALVNAMRGVMLNGDGVSAVLGPVLVLVAWGVASLLAAMWLFRWQ